MQNGARVYYELKHLISLRQRTLPEYATPECMSATEATLHEFAGMRLMEEYAREIMPDTRYPVFKRSGYAEVTKDGKVLMAAKSLGHHETYSTPLSLQPGRPYVEPFISYLATRPIWAGAGLVSPEGYHAAQRVGSSPYLSAGGSDDKHGHKRAISDIKIDRNGRHVEVRSGDSNMSPWALRTTLAFTSLVLRLIEHNKFPSSALMPAEMRGESATQASYNPNQPLIGTLGNMSAVEQQALIAEAALNFALENEGHLPAEELDAALDVVQVCRDIRVLGQDPDALELLIDRVDWAAKLHHIRQQLGAKTLITAGNLDAVKLDLTWEALGKHSPSYEHFKVYGNIIDDRAIDKALVTPPKTRAAQRVQALRSLNPKDVTRVDWSVVSCRNGVRPAMMSDVYTDQLTRL